MHLLDLPLDIINLIVTELKCDATAGDFYHLALTCRTFRDLVLHLIPWNVAMSSPSWNYAAFFGTLQRTPGYASRVHSFHALPHSNPTMSSLDHHVLWLLPNLHTLRCSYVSKSCHMSLFFSHLPMRNTLVRISGIQIDRGLLYAALSLPNLKHLDCLVQDETLRDIARVESGVTHLELDDQGSSWVIQEFHELITNVPVLGSLKCNIPYSVPTYRTPIAMNYLRYILTHISGTLTSLELFTGIYSTNRYLWDGDDYGTLDLHGFPVLRNISASAILFLGPSTTSSDSRKQDLYTRLPRSLKTLCLSFCYDTCIFFSTRVNYLPRNRIYRNIGAVDYQGRQRFISNTLREDEYSWIMNLASEKSGALPSLLSVTLYEVTYWHHEFLQFEPWCPPENARTAYSEANIRLNVQIRAPKPQFDERIAWEWENIPSGVQVRNNPQYQDIAMRNDLFPLPNSVI